MCSRSWRPALAALAIGLATLGVVACGGDGDDEDGGGEPTRVPTADVAGGDPAAGSCSVTLSGDESLTIQGNGGVAAVGSDYWYTDDELRATLEFLLKEDGDSDADVDRKVDEAMASDEPKIYILILNCIDRDDESVSVSLLPSNESTYDDIPFGPGEYAIPSNGEEAGPGTFAALMSTVDTVYNVANAGTLAITKFDGSGIAGEFSFVAEEVFAAGDASRVSVTGRFEFDCQGGGVCER